MASRPNPPALQDRVDVYWPYCERYFRGTVARATRESRFTFFILYDDNDYKRTDLNKVRWHYVTDGCCPSEQDVMRIDDFTAGDMRRAFGSVRRGLRKRKACSKGVSKRRRGRRILGDENSVGGLGKGASEATFVASESGSVVQSSSAGGSSVGEESGVVVKVFKAKDGAEGRCSAAAGERGLPKEGERVALDRRVHWKKSMLSEFRRGGGV